MSELISPALLTPIHQIPAALFVEAFNGRYDNKTEGMSLLTGKEIRKTKHDFIQLFHLYIDEELLYLLIDNAELILTKWTIELKEIGKRGKPLIHVLFFKSILPGIWLNDSISGNWLLRQSVIKGSFELNSSQCREVKFFDSSKCDRINVFDSSKCDRINVFDSSKIELISISASSQCGDVDITNWSKNELINISDSSQCGDIAISGSSQNGNINISNSSQCGDIDISGSSQNGDINISYSSQCRNIRVSGSSQSGDISIYDSHLSTIDIVNQYSELIFSNAIIPLIKLEDCHLQELQWKSGSKGELYMTRGSLNHLHFKKTALLKDSVFSFSNVAMHIVQLEEVLTQGQLMLRNIQPIQKDKFPIWKPFILNDLEKYKPANGDTNLKIENYTSFVKALEEKEKVHKQSIEWLTELFPNGPVLLIANSSLGKTEITGSDLRDFNFEYRDSKMLDCFISGTQLPRDNIGIYQNKDPKRPQGNKDYYTQKISFYNQLRKLYESLGDIVEASWYQSKAMDNQQKLLELDYREKLNNPKWYQIHRRFSEQGFDLLTFRLNKVSNNHGESWRKALGFSLIVTFSIYSLYYVSLFYNRSFSLSGTSRFWGDYFSFLDITHKQNFLVEKPTAPAKLFDFMGRIAIGYCLYQFIAAFRRHGRKAI